MPLRRKAWNKGAPDICVESLTENDTAATQYFSLPEVQYVGSTSGCGCDFPHVMFQNGDWPFFEELEEKDAESEASDRKNREELFRLLMSTGEEAVELYGVWNGDFSTPKAREQISLEKILDPHFRFKEQGFYAVSVKNDQAKS
jgi:hypothetical protein